MKRILPILVLLVFVSPSLALALIPLESRIVAPDAESRALLGQLEKSLGRCEKRMQEVFGIVPRATAVAGHSQDVYDFLLTLPDAVHKGKQAGLLLINTRVVQDYSPDDLGIAAARSLYQAVWPKFRKPYATDHVLIDRLYTEGMTAYAAELIVPKAVHWKYAGFLIKQGKELYGQYLEGERDLAAAVLQAIRTGTERKCLEKLFWEEESAQAPQPFASGRLLSYRVMKTLEKDIDPKMIQLMGFEEFRDRLPRCLEVLQKGFDMKSEWKY